MAFDAFLKIDGIDGESLDKFQKGSIEVESFSWGVVNLGSASGGGGGAGKAVPQDFHFTQKVSKASPNLMLACCTGKHLKKAVLTVRKAGASRGGQPQDFLVIKLADCLVSSFQPAGEGSGDEGPEESISLNFVKIDFSYKVLKTGEIVETTFDFSQDR